MGTHNLSLLDRMLLACSLSLSLPYQSSQHPTKRSPLFVYAMSTDGTYRIVFHNYSSKYWDKQSSFYFAIDGGGERKAGNPSGVRIRIFPYKDSPKKTWLVIRRADVDNTDEQLRGFVDKGIMADYVAGITGDSTVTSGAPRFTIRQVQTRRAY